MGILLLLKLAFELLIVGAMSIFLFIVAFSCISNLLFEQWYWNRFIPKLHVFENRHPRLTTVFLSYTLLFSAIGIVYIILLR